MAREHSTVNHMIELYCKGNHRPEGALCQDCQELKDYAGSRLEKCPFQENKSTCLKCRVHCYEPGMRERIREVMRYSGPRMLLRHPLLTIRHILDGFGKRQGKNE